MFLRYLEPLAAPFKAIRNRWVGIKNVQGRMRVDVGRVKSYKQLAKYRAKEAKQMASDARKKAGAAGGRLGGGQPGAPPAQLGPGQFMPPGAMPAGAMAGGGMQGGGMQGGPMQGGMHGGYPAGGAMAYQGPMSGGGPPLPPGGAPGYPPPGGGPGFPGGPGPQGYPPGGPPPMNGGIVVTGMLWWKKHLCAQCGQQLDKTWDRCPYCIPGGAPIAASNKTQAIMLDAAGVGAGLKLCGWLVGLKGPQRGELFTLEPVTSVGTDPGCTIVLGDSYMSSRHCEIRAEAGVWVLRDLRSTNGTYVNDKRIEQHELVDSDFIKLGQSVMKFKSL